jgi:hypothetical protein
MINNKEDFKREDAKLTKSFWEEYCAADVKRSWNSLTRQSLPSQNDIVRKYASRFEMLRTLAKMKGIKVTESGDRDKVTLTVPADENPLLEG